MSQQGRLFKHRYYRDINNLSQCSPVLLSGNVQSEYVAAGEVVQKRYYRNIDTLSLCRLGLLLGNLQSQHVAAVERVQITLL